MPAWPPSPALIPAGRDGQGPQLGLPRATSLAKGQCCCSGQRSASGRGVQPPPAQGGALLAQGEEEGAGEDMPGPCMPTTVTQAAQPTCPPPPIKGGGQALPSPEAPAPAGDGAAAQWRQEPGPDPAQAAAVRGPPKPNTCHPPAHTPQAHKSLSSCAREQGSPPKRCPPHSRGGWDSRELP